MAPLPRAPEIHFPCTIETVEGPLERIYGEFPHEVLEAKRGSKRTVIRNRPVNILRTILEPRLSGHGLAGDGHRDDGRLAATTDDCGGTTPFAVKRTRGTRFAELPQEQQLGD